MRPTNIASIVVAAITGFIAVYATLTMRGNGESQDQGRIEEKSKKIRADRLRAFIFHKDPKPVPEFTFTDVAGKTRSISEWRGKVVILNLWATWCGPCREEMPSLDRLKSHFSNNEFDVVAISLDRGGLAKVQNFYGEARINKLDLYIDPTTKLMFKLKAVGLPATLLIDANGREIGRIPGPAQWDGDLAIKMIKDALAKK